MDTFEKRGYRKTYDENGKLVAKVRIEETTSAPTYTPPTPVFVQDEDDVAE